MGIPQCVEGDLWEKDSKQEKLESVLPQGNCCQEITKTENIMRETRAEKEATPAFCSLLES